MAAAKAASLFTYQNAVSAKFNALEYQKHPSALDSITKEKISKIPIQYQFANTSTSTIMILTKTGNSLSWSE